jgi:hypothetical protein
VESTQLLSLTHFCLLKFQHLLTCTFLFFVITDYNVHFFVRCGSVGLHWLIPPYDYLTFITCFDWFWYTVIQMFIYYYYYYYYYYYVRVLNSSSSSSFGTTTLCGFSPSQPSLCQFFCP